MKKKIVVTFIFLNCFLGASDYSIDQARKIDAFLKKIAKDKRNSVFLKKISFTERELNSYLNLIYLKKYAPEVKSIHLGLHKNNNVTGEMKVKLAGEKFEKVPSFLKEFRLTFSGVVECENYRIRYMFEKLEINGTSFSPEILDEAFYAAQTGFDVKKSIFDWFSLMPGLKNVLTDTKKITLFY
jgi:hypothetical protein